MTGHELRALCLAAHKGATSSADIGVLAAAQRDRANRLLGARGDCAVTGSAAPIGRGSPTGILPAGNAATHQQGHY